MELGDGSFVEMEWSGLIFDLNLDIYLSLLFFYI